MNLPRIYTLLLSTIAMLTCFATKVHACTCAMYYEPPCSAYWRAEAVFIGVVTDIKDSPEASFPHRLSVMFSIEESFRGVKGKQFELKPETTTCGFDFEKGKRYLVYAHKNRWEDSLGADACTRTRELKYAAEDLNYFRSLSTGTAERSILGRFRPYLDTPLKAIKIVAQGNGENHAVFTDDEGKFKIVVAKSGKYKVRFMFPPKSSLFAGHFTFEGNGKVEETNKNTILEYEMELEPGKCIYWESELSVSDGSP